MVKRHRSHRKGVAETEAEESFKFLLLSKVLFSTASAAHEKLKIL